VDRGPEPFAKDLIVRSLTFSNGHTCVLVDDGGIYCRGDVGFGQLGIGDVSISAGGACAPAKCVLTFTRVPGSQTWKQVQAGFNFTCALADDGAAWCWGNGSSKPQPVVGDHRFAQIAVGDEHACGRTTEGALFCWGRGKDGELGHDSLTGSRTPVRVTGSTSFASVYAGGRRTCGLTAEGAAWCWGAGKRGQLGNGELAERVPHPVAVTGGLSFATLALARGGDTTCGVTTEGTVACWGKNNSGQLGDGGKADSSQPVRASLP
jgi:alpha-tubulin suppressor-like RCC1 family protein